ncbi:hypothetical protein JCM3775_006621 [Rhodotorula graminis]
MSTAAAAPSTDPAAVAAAAAEQLARFQFAVANITTPVVIGSFIACMMCGILLYMSATYFVRFGSSDRLSFKILVGFLTVACVGDTMNECAWAWLVTIKVFADPTIVAQLPETFTVYAIFTGVTVLVAQVFFTWRLWVISERRNWWLPVGMLVLELTAAGLAMYLAWWTDKTMYLASFPEIEGIMWAWISAGIVIDVLITGGITFYLLIRPQRLGGGVLKTNRSSPLGRLVVKSFQTNGVSLLLQTVTLIVIVTRRGTLWYNVPGFQEARCYAINVIATLNARTLASSDAGDSFNPDPRSTLTSKQQQQRTGATSAARRSRMEQQSMPVFDVHVEVQVDEADSADAESDKSGGGGGASKELVALGSTTPYSVTFERASVKDGDDIELGMKEGRARGEPGWARS